MQQNECFRSRRIGVTIGCDLYYMDARSLIEILWKKNKYFDYWVISTTLKTVFLLCMNKINNGYLYYLSVFRKISTNCIDFTFQKMRSLEWKDWQYKGQRNPQYHTSKCGLIYVLNMNQALNPGCDIEVNVIHLEMENVT